MIAGIDLGRDYFFPWGLNPSTLRFFHPERRLDRKRTLEWVDDHCVKAVCLDGPPTPNRGLLSSLLPAVAEGGRNRRLGEFSLGIGGCYGTPAHRPAFDAYNGWMAEGMELYEALSAHLGRTTDLGNGDGRVIETHPTYAFKALLGVTAYQQFGIDRFRVDPRRLLRPKKRQGFGQRIRLLQLLCDQLAITVTGEDVRKWLERIDWVDATMCCIISYLRILEKPDVLAVGHPSEGSIFLYAPTSTFSVEE